MKKSKIVGISLGSVALVGVVVATPLIVISCSRENFVDMKVNPYALNIVQWWTEKDGQNIIKNVIIESNNIDIKVNLKSNPFILFSIKDKVSDVISEEDIKKYGLSSNYKINWSIDGWIEVPDGPLSQQSFAKEHLKNGDKFNLIGTINNNLRFKINVNISQI